MAKRLQVLMSAYNGKKYIIEQLDSIFAQTYPNVEVLVRDDGSKDNTVELLEEYKKTHSNLTVFAEQNIGLTKSFLSLVAKSDADYVAFSDQDDYWLPEKLEKAVKKLERIDGPALYCSNQILTDGKLNPLDNSNMPSYTAGFGNALIETICTGCTCVMNKALVDNIKTHMPDHAIWHDWWAYLVASYIGTVVFDENAYIYYRQHGGNKLGASRSALVMIRNKWEYLKKSKGKLGRQLEDFKRLYRDNKEKDALVDLLLDSRKNMGSRLKLVATNKIYRQRGLDNFVVKCLYLINRML
ncbi:MAG: glycosyltransferase family 2 protein [Lachnospiraceae bacterium]|nr:glycosyltransferase family 2 protein [Lachnospiraceae bacterium]